MKRRIIFILVIIIIIVTSPFVSLLIHELGHFIMSICLGAQVNSINIGTESYVNVNISQLSNFEIAMIAVGSFIIPEIIYLVLFISKNFYIVLFRIFTGVTLYVHIFLSIFVLLFGTNEPETYDILLFKNYTNINSITIIVVLVLMLLANIIFEVLTKSLNNIVENLIQELDR